MSESPAEDQEFRSMTGDDAQARRLRRSLERIAERSSDPTMQEMAREVLAGRVGLRKAARIPAYGEAMAQGMQEGIRAWQNMPAGERHEAEEQGRRQLDEIQQGLDEEVRERNRAGRGKHSGRDWRL